jgi:hypothetical protein
VVKRDGKILGGGVFTAFRRGLERERRLERVVHGLKFFKGIENGSWIVPSNQT